MSGSLASTYGRGHKSFLDTEGPSTSIAVSIFLICKFNLIARIILSVIDILSMAKG